jgi:hypothetical protein
MAVEVLEDEAEAVPTEFRTNEVRYTKVADDEHPALK